MRFSESPIIAAYQTETPTALSNHPSEMPLGVIDYAPHKEFDTGLFVARYLQVMSLLDIIAMIAVPIFQGGAFIDLSPLLWLWAASELKRHSSTARKWMIGFCGLYLGLCIFGVVNAVIWGTKNTTISIGHPIQNPALWQVLLVAGVITVVACVPFVVLLTKTARRQFANRTADDE